MATRSYTSRRELEEHSFHWAVSLLVPVAAILLQVLLPRPFPRLALLDLPLIAVIFFAVARRNPVAGSLTGAVIGLVQDSLTGRPIGVNGIAKSVVGFAASSIGVNVDVENITTRVMMNFLFSLLQSVLLYGIDRYLLGLRAEHILWGHELLRATFNTLLAIPLFVLLDRTKISN